MKVIFVDIDGPLAFNSSGEGDIKIRDGLTLVYAWNEKACEALAKIIKKTGAKVVISSDWKKYYSVEEFNEIFEFYKIPPVVIDATSQQKAKLSSPYSMDRAYQIMRWLEKRANDIESWVAIDDLHISEYFKSAVDEEYAISEKNAVLVIGGLVEMPELSLENNVTKIIKILNGRKQ